jgi:hypothetical protein
LSAFFRHNRSAELKRDILCTISLYQKENPVLSSTLESQYQASGPQVRDAIRELRREGHPLANSDNGYYYARLFSEIEPTLSDLESRALSMLSTVKLTKERFYPAQKEQTNLFNQ